MNEEYLEDETIVCDECEKTIGSSERYYEINDKFYCEHCLNELFSKWN